MKGGMFNSIYLLVFIAAFLIFLPVAFWLNGGQDEMFMSERRNLEKQAALNVLNGVRSSASLDPSLLLEDLKTAVRTVNARQKDFQFLNAGMYAFVERTGADRSCLFSLSGHHADNILDRPPETIIATKEELLNFGRPGSPLSYWWIPIPFSESPEHLLLVTTRDIRLKDLIGSRGFEFWAVAGLVFILLYVAIAFVIYAVIKKPLLKLQSILMSEEESLDKLEPEDFGDFGELVQALKAHVDRMRSSVATAANVDPVTGLMSGQMALSAYLDIHKNADEVFAIFLRANFAKEYVKTCGRAFRDRILKLLGSSVATALPSGARLFAVQDHFMMTFLTEPAFHQCYPAIQKYFNRAIRPLYEKGEGDRTQVMTVSAVGISNKSIGFEVFHDLLQKLHDDWGSLVNRQMGGWAIMNSDDQWVKGLPEEDAAGGAEPEPVPEEPESLKDPAFARKVFIVKLAFMFQFDPKKAAKLYKLGFTRLPAILQDGVLDSIRKFGAEAEADVKQLIEKMRLVPKHRLYYNETDFKQVFITDVRMIRKIPRDIAGRWFEAGFRRLEDLADMAPEDILKIDGAAGDEDVRAVVAQAKAFVTSAAKEQA